MQQRSEANMKALFDFCLCLTPAVVMWVCAYEFGMITTIVILLGLLMITMLVYYILKYILKIVTILS